MIGDSSKRSEMDRPAVKRRVVVTLGMHRSGTSLFARLLATLGVDLGGGLIAGREDNPEGFWEQAEIVAIHDEILARLGRAWATPRQSLPYPPAWWRDEALIPYKKRLAAIVERELAQTPGLWGFKDPRTCRLLPLWQELFERLEIEPVYVLTVRHPLAVSASLVERDKISPEQAQLLWLEHNLEALRHSRGRLRLVLDYDRWFDQPREQAETALAAMGLAWPSDKAELDRALAAVIRPELRRQRASEGRCLPLVAETYALLREAAAGGGIPEGIWEIDAQFRKAQDLLAGWAEAADKPVDFAALGSAMEAARAARHAAEGKRESPAVREFPPLVGDAGEGKPRRVCIVSSDLVGPIRNGGIGTACTALAEALAAAGHEVSLLYVLGEYCEKGVIADWVADYAKRGIRLVPLPALRVQLDGPWALARAGEVYEWLKGQAFDVVHFPEWRGHGYFCLLAKHQGLAFRDTILAVTTHSPVLWHKLGNAEALDRIEDLEMDFMERECVRLADVAVSPSRYLLEWLQDQHWMLPARCHVQQNILPPAARGVEPSPQALSVNELVFFGRLETRKGLVLFCDALDRLAGMQPPGFSVTFLGKEAPVEGKSAAAYLAERARQWNFGWKIVSGLDHKGALDYLNQAARLAVIPSLVENSPYTVLECLGAGIPFLAARVGGIPELIHPEDLETATFPTRPWELAVALLRGLREGARPARAAHSPEETERAWLDWHATLPLPGPAAPAAESRPLVSVCLTHHERPALLAQAVASLEAQDYPNLEVVLVDDGSVSAEARAYLASLEPRFAARGWRIVRQENRYLGAARNNVARHASGEWLMFMDDDNCARPHEVSTFVKAALASGADILTCLMDRFEGQGAPGPGQHPQARWLPLGGAAAVGALRNCFGDANALVRRSCFMALGGFSEDYGLGHEDWEFFARAVLAGYRVELVPEPLFWYRVSAGSMLRSTQAHANYMRSLRPYMDAVPDALRDLVVFTQGLERRQEASPPPSFESLKADAEVYWNSLSWQIFAPLRNALRRLRGLPPERMPELASAEEAARLIEAIRKSLTWELTGPLRVLGRLFGRGAA